MDPQINGLIGESSDRSLKSKGSIGPFDPISVCEVECVVRSVRGLILLSVDPCVGESMRRLIHVSVDPWVYGSMRRLIRLSFGSKNQSIGHR